MRRLLNLLIALSVATGLVSVPFAAPAVAKPHRVAGGVVLAMDGNTHAMAGEANGAMQAMSDAVPCCPDEGIPAKDCDSCPLMALCSLTIPVPARAGVAGLAPELTARTAFAFPDDLLIDGLGARPPDHPPRTLG